jgi:hypothetical protein
MKYYMFATILFKYDPDTYYTYMWVDRVGEWTYYGDMPNSLPGTKPIDSTTYKHPAFVKEQFYKDLLCNQD